MKWEKRGVGRVRHRWHAPPGHVFLLTCCGLFVGLAASGCTGSADPLGRQEISGSVTLDGQPLDTGSIRFEPQEGGATASGAMIVNGVYAVPANQGLAPGVYRVFITAVEADSEKRTGEEVMNNPGPPKKELIPAKYNQQSEVTVEVKAESPNNFDFPITSK